MMIEFPEAFHSQMEPLLGPQWPSLEKVLRSDSPISCRINQGKWVGSVPGKPISWCDTGFYLPERPLFTLDPRLHAGCYYVQEASSMFLQQALQQIDIKEKQRNFLDLCAAPGGKASLVADQLKEGDLLVANEVIRSRSHILAENLTKWGESRVVVSNNDPRDFGKLRSFFDVAVVDAPCSGEGMFRKDPNAINEWSKENVALCADRQRRILADVWEAIAPGGFLIYSTCTYNRRENEENVQWLVENFKASSVALSSLPDTEIMVSEYKDITGYRFYPHKVDGEGFFMAIVQKEEGLAPKSSKKKKRSKPTVFSEVASWLKPGTSYVGWKDGDTLYAAPETVAERIQFLRENLNTLISGLTLGVEKGHKVAPSPALALAQDLNKEAFPRAEVSLKEANNFLKREPLQGLDAPLGMVLVTFNDYPLGWVKNLGNRTNNQYVKEWRIRMTLPDLLPPLPF